MSIALPLLPNEILFMIACDNVKSLCTMAMAVPFIGRLMLDGEKRASLLEKYTYITRDQYSIHYYIIVDGSRVLHCEDGPAVSTTCGGEYKKEWFKWGVSHRENSPAYISYNTRYDLYRFIWRTHGKITAGVFICPVKGSAAVWNHECRDYKCIDYDANGDIITNLLKFGKRVLCKN